MTYSKTSEIARVECPDYGSCSKAGCPRFLVRVSKQGIDDDGNQLYGGACILNGETEWFDGCLPFREQKQQVKTDSAFPGANAKKGRYRGHSQFDGQRIHQAIESDSRKQSFKISGREFKLTRPIDWQVADQFLQAVKDREDGYVINMSTADRNRLSQAGKDFVKHCIDRQRVANPNKGQKYTGKARIKPGVLRPNQICRSI